MRGGKRDQRPSQTWKRPVARWKRSCPTCGAPPRQGGVMYVPAGLLSFLAYDQAGVVQAKCANCQLAPAIVLPSDG
jgi:hypothetical protein